MHTLFFTSCPPCFTFRGRMLYNMLPPPDHSLFHTCADTKVDLQDSQLYEVISQSTPYSTLLRTQRWTCKILNVTKWFRYQQWCCLLSGHTHPKRLQLSRTKVARKPITVKCTPRQQSQWAAWKQLRHQPVSGPATDYRDVSYKAQSQSWNHVCWWHSQAMDSAALHATMK